MEPYQFVLLSVWGSIGVFGAIVGWIDKDDIHPITLVLSIAFGLLMGPLVWALLFILYYFFALKRNN